MKSNLLSNKKICYYIGSQHKAFLNIRFNKGSFVLDQFRYIKKWDGVKIVEIRAGAKIQKIWFYHINPSLSWWTKDSKS